MIDEEDDAHVHITKVSAPTTLLHNRVAVRYILAHTAKNAYEQMIKEQMITKEELAQNMGEPVVVVEAMLKSMDVWSIEMLADFLWGLGLNISGIMLATMNNEEDDEEDEDDEDERIH